MKTLYIALLTLVMWLFVLMAFAMLMMVVFSDKNLLIPAVLLFATPALGAWYLRKRAKEVNIMVMFPQRKLKNNKPEKDIHCPHCQAAFEEMPKKKRRCPYCKEWIWPMRPPGMQHKRLTTVEQALAWKLEDAKLDSPLSYARELTKQSLPSTQAFDDAAEQEFAEFREEVNDGLIPDAFDFIAAPDSCNICKQFARNSPYKLADLPKPVVDTHDDCRCCVAPHA